MVPKNLSGFSWFFPPCFFKFVYYTLCPLEKRNNGNERVKLSKKFIENYIAKLREERFSKEKNIFDNAHRHIFTHEENNTFFSLKDIFQKQHILRKYFIQNEISSINQNQHNKIVIFHTSTIDPVLNVPRKIDEAKLLEEQIKKQYEEFSKYFRTITKRNHDKKITYKNIRVYELTKKLNIHCHKTDFLNSEAEFVSYLESIVLSRKKNDIGRVELVVNADFFETVRKLFKDKQIKIRVNNKYEILSLLKRSIKFQGKKQDIFIIKETKKGEGNFIYFRTIEDDKGTGQHLTDYMFKYMLKSFDYNEEDKPLQPRSKVSKETLIFSKLKLRQKIYSTNFFSDKLQKDDLEKLNGRFFTFFKQLERNKTNILSFFNKNDLDYISNGRRHLLYTLSQMLDDKRIFVVEENKDILVNEYKVIKSIVRSNIEAYNQYDKEGFFDLIRKKYEYKNTLNERQLKKAIHKEIDHIFSVEGFKKSYQEMFDFEWDEPFTEEEITQEQERKENLIITLTQKIFSIFAVEHNYKNTDKEVYYFNNETSEAHLIHSFSSDYTYEKYSSDMELYEDILTNKKHFNDTDELQSAVNYYNAITELFDLPLELLTVQKVKEDLRLEREEKRDYQNKQIEAVLENQP